jgi:hypothetical protein
MEERFWRQNLLLYSPANNFRRFAKHVSKDDNNNVREGDAWTRLAAQAAEPYNSFWPYMVHAV